MEVLSSLVWLSSAWFSPSTKSREKAQVWELWEWLDTTEEWETKGPHCWRSGCEYQGKEGWKQDVLFMGEKKKLLNWRGAEEMLQLCTAHHWEGEDWGVIWSVLQQDVALSTGWMHQAAPTCWKLRVCFTPSPIPNLHLCRGGVQNCCQPVLSVIVFRGKHDLMLRVPGDPTLSWELLGKHRAGLKSDIARTELLTRQSGSTGIF